MVTSIQISEETKKKLLMIMAEIQKQRGQKITYEEAINYLIEKDSQSFSIRKKFAQKYRGFINKDQAKLDLAEARKLER